MIDLDFTVQNIEIARDSAVPLLVFRLHLANRSSEYPVEHVMLQSQIRIETAHRSYKPAEQERLIELFGAAEDWSRTLHSMLWTNTSTAVSAFAGDCNVALPVPCSYDFNIAATKYFYGLQDGEVPLLMMFSGTIFFRNAAGDLQIVQIAHDKEAGYRLPVQIWQKMMDRYYPDSVWLRFSRDLFEEIYRYKRQNRLASWEEALRLLLKGRAEAG